MDINFVIPCLLGMESLIAAELKELGAENVNAENDGATVSTYTESVTGIKTGITDVSGQPITFTFYVAENRYNHSGLSGIYPDGWLTEKPEEDVKGYNPESEEDLKKINGVKYFYDENKNKGTNFKNYYSIYTYFF